MFISSNIKCREEHLDIQVQKRVWPNNTNVLVGKPVNTDEQVNNLRLFGLFLAPNYSNVMYELSIYVWCMFVCCTNSRRCPDQENCGAVPVDTCTHVTLGKYV